MKRTISLSVILLVCLNVQAKSQNVIGSAAGSASAEEDNYYVQNDLVSITCGENKVIKITAARYGKPGKNKCGDPNAKNVVEGVCNYKPTCDFTVVDSLFNSNCMGKDVGKQKLSLDYKCVSDPCACYYCSHGGSCTLNNEGKPACTCVGWSGLRCDDNPCDKHACPVTATCVIKEDGSPKCCCHDGYTGDDCSTPVDACTINPCRNGGTCSVVNRRSECTCPPEYVGDLCEISCSPPASGCPPGFQEIPPGSGDCYFICVEESQSWLKAQETCVSLGASLWEPNTVSERNNIFALLSGNNNYWTGANDQLNEGSTVFVGSGAPFPNGLTTDATTNEKDCVEVTKVGSNFQLQYRRCDVLNRKCICEIPNPCPHS